MRGDNVSGKLGEAYASKYLANNNYTVLCRNYKTKFAEIDIIAMDNSSHTLCFTEVKTRRDKFHGMGSDFVNKTKIDKIILGARSYIASKNIECDIRFDVIEIYAVSLPSGFVVSELNHIKNAFEAF